MIFILTGLKHSGKSTIARHIANVTGCPHYDTDDVITAMTGLSPRSIYERGGKEAFIKAEKNACSGIVSLFMVSQNSDTTLCNTKQDTKTKDRAAGIPCCNGVVATGGGICDNPEALNMLRTIGTVVFLDVPLSIVWERIETEAVKTGVYPPFLRTENPFQTFSELFERRRALYLQNSDKTLDIYNTDTPESITAKLCP